MLWIFTHFSQKAQFWSPSTPGQEEHFLPSRPTTRMKDHINRVSWHTVATQLTKHTFSLLQKQSWLCLLGLVLLPCKSFLIYKMRSDEMVSKPLYQWCPEEPFSVYLHADKYFLAYYQKADEFPRLLIYSQVNFFSLRLFTECEKNWDFILSVASPQPSNTANLNTDTKLTIFRPHFFTCSLSFLSPYILVLFKKSKIGDSKCITNEVKQRGNTHPHSQLKPNSQLKIKFKNTVPIFIMLCYE